MGKINYVYVFWTRRVRSPFFSNPAKAVEFQEISLLHEKQTFAHPSSTDEVAAMLKSDCYPFLFLNLTMAELQKSEKIVYACFFYVIDC